MVAELVGLEDLIEVQTVLKGIEMESMHRLATPFAKLVFSELVGEVARLLEDNKSAIKYFKESEYYSRRLGLDHYTIRICFHIAETLKKMASFE